MAGRDKPTMSRGAQLAIKFKVDLDRMRAEESPTVSNAAVTENLETTNAHKAAMRLSGHALRQAERSGPNTRRRRDQANLPRKQIQSKEALIQAG